MAVVRRVCRAWVVVLAACGSSPTPPDATLIDGPPPLYELAAVRPTIATVGATVSLEGTFGATTTVMFPGGVNAAATVKGSHRASVIVPAGATTGTLTVTSDGHVVGTASFRTSTFALGLFATDEYGQGMRQPPVLGTPRGGHASVTIGNRVIVIGGTSSTATLSSVEQALIDSDGSLEPFAVLSGTVLTTPRTGHTATVIGSYVYVIGGTDGTAALNSVERAQIAADGSLGTFATVAGSQLASARIGHSATVIGDALYVVGGTDGNTALASVERAQIAQDGSLGAFQIVAESQLVVGRASAASVVIGDYLYVIGGTSTMGPLDSVEVATIFPDGLLSTFTTVNGLTMLSRATSQTAIVVGPYLYLLGGKDATGGFVPHELATIEHDNTLGGFVDASGAVGLAPSRYGQTVEVVGNRLFAIGGNNNFGFVGAVQSATIDTGGSLGPFSATQVSLATSRNDHTSVVLGKYLYVIGGLGAAASTIERVTIEDDGTLSSLPTVYSVTLVTGRSGHTSAVIGNYVYVFGGRDSTGAPISSVERAPFSPDGTLGAFATVSGVTLVAARYDHTTAVFGNAVFVIGGVGSGGTVLGSTERALINPDGTIGAFATSVSLVAPRHAHSQVVAGSGLLELGGTGSTGSAIASIETAAFTTDAQGNTALSSFSTFSQSLAAPRAAHRSFRIGPYVYVIGGTSGTIERSALGPQDAFKALPGVALYVSAYSTAVIGNHFYIVSGQNIQQASLQ